MEGASRVGAGRLRCAGPLGEYNKDLGRGRSCFARPMVRKNPEASVTSPQANSDRSKCRLIPGPRRGSLLLGAAIAAGLGTGHAGAAVLNPGETLTNLFAEDFQGASPLTFSVASGNTGGSTTTLTDSGSAGNNAIECRDSNVFGSGGAANSGSTIRGILTGTTVATGKTFVDRVNAILKSPAGTSATFLFEFDVMRTVISSAPVLGNMAAGIQFSQNDGNPPASGTGRFRFPTGTSGLSSIGTLSDYTSTPAQFRTIDNADISSYRFTVTSDGNAAHVITNAWLDFGVRVNTLGTEEAYVVDNVKIGEIAVPEPASLGLWGLGSLLLLRRRRHRAC